MKIIKKIAGFVLIMGVASFFSSCSNTASFKGKLDGGNEKEIVVKRLDVSSYTVLDTLRTNKNGNFSSKVEVEKGQPEFIYLFYGDRKIGSMLLSKGEKVTINADTLGNYTVQGSPESVKLLEVETDFAKFMSEITALAIKIDSPSVSNEEAKELNAKISRIFVDYYRSRVKYLLDNPKSLTSTNVLFQEINPNFPVFSQATDAIHFKSLAESLSEVYPDSKYVKSLKREAARRENIMNIQMKLDSAEQLSFPEINLPDIHGEKVKLSEIDAKLIMVNFWSASAAGNKLYNQDVLKKLYDRYHSKGLEIYQVCIDADKANWASIVKSQELPWISVCDGLGYSSPAVRSYNLGSQLPVSFFITKDKGLLEHRVSGNYNALQKVVVANL